MRGSDAGFYVIEVGGGASERYTFDYRLGAFVIEKALATIAVSDLRQAANGGTKRPTIETIPPDLPLRVTYDGDSEAPSEAGEYLLEIAINDPNYQGKVSMTFFLEQALSAGVQDLGEWTVYPNPASDWIKVKGPEAPFEIEILTLEGKLVERHAVNGTEPDLSIDHLQKGVYLISLKDVSTGVAAVQRLLVR